MTKNEQTQSSSPHPNENIGKKILGKKSYFSINSFYGFSLQDTKDIRRDIVSMAIELSKGYRMIGTFGILLYHFRKIYRIKEICK